MEKYTNINEALILSVRLFIRFSTKHLLYLYNLGELCTKDEIQQHTIEIMLPYLLISSFMSNVSYIQNSLFPIFVCYNK